MKKLSRLLPVYAVLAGIGCALLRASLYAGLDDKGLIPAGHPAELPLTVLTVLSALILALGCIWSENRDHRCRVRFPVQGVGCIFGAASQVLWLLQNTGNSPLFSLCSGASALCFLILAYYRFAAKKPPLWTLAVINLSYLILCFGQYRQWGTYTQLQGYLFPALSALFLALHSLQYLLQELPEQVGRKAHFCCLAALLCSLACLSTSGWPSYLAASVWLVSCLFTRPYAMAMPEDVLRCIDNLEKAGFSAYAVGGCVRDSMLGLIPHDYDLCTNAKPEDICLVFQNFQLVRSGEKHGTIGVVINRKVYEITTYRTEGTYEDNRHPDSVTFVDRVEEDLSRRDFTVNAMACHPKTGYLDPFGGENDLFSGVLRTVGDPETRFREDALRILRGVRFACRFDLQPEEQTEKAMTQLSPLLDNLARERVCSELTQILCVMNDQTLPRFSPVLLQVIPELSQCVDFSQHNSHHRYDVFTHTAKVLSCVEPDPALRWAALLHDVGKPQTYTQDEKGTGHFHGHAKVSADMAEDILRRLKVSNALREQVVFLIAHHMDELRLDEALLRRKLSKYGAQNLTKLLALQRADRIGTGKDRGSADRHYEKALALVQKLERESCLQIRDLALDGHDLMLLGFLPGPRLGECQKYLLELVLSGAVPNKKEPLTEKAKEFLNQ